MKIDRRREVRGVAEAAGLPFDAHDLAVKTCIRSLLKAFYQDTSNSTRRRAGPPPTCGARAGGLTSYPNPCDPRNSGRTRS